jgi:phenylacetate-CoA ligase
LVSVDRAQLFEYHESFGTTGTPASGWLTREELDNYATQINHAAVNLQPGDRVLVRFPYAISVPAHIVTQAARNRGACVIPASSRTAISPYPRVIDLLAKLEATVMGCLPMEAVWLAETARLMGRDPARDFPHLRAISTAGELLSDARRDRIAALWNARVYNMYGCTEAGNIAADCEHGRLHLSWDHFLLETLDEQTWQPVAEGELGTAVLTTLTRQAMPLLRFVLGDFLRVRTDHGCPCGRRSPVVEHFGRDLNRFQFRGRWYFVRDLEERLLHSPSEVVGNLWVLEVRDDEVRFRTETDQPQPKLYRQLEEQVRVESELPLVIDPVPVGGLLDRSRLMKVEPVNKPRIVGFCPAGSWWTCWEAPG